MKQVYTDLYVKGDVRMPYDFASGVNFSGELCFADHENSRKIAEIRTCKNFRAEC